MADSDKGSMRASELESLVRANEQRYCRHCGQPITPDGQGSWVDSTDGDGCEDLLVHEPAPTYAYYEGVSEHGARVIFTVVDGKVADASSPTHACFRSISLGEPWATVRSEFEARGFRFHGGH